MTAQNFSHTMHQLLRGIQDSEAYCRTCGRNWPRRLMKSKTSDQCMLCYNRIRDKRKRLECRKRLAA